MGTKEDLHFLEDERKKLWVEITQLKDQLQQIQHLTPEQVTAVLTKSAEIAHLYEQANTTFASVTEKNQKISSYVSTINDIVAQSKDKLTNIELIDKNAEKLYETASTSSIETINISDQSKDIKDELDIAIADIRSKSQKLEELNLIYDTSEELKEKIDLAYGNIDKNYKEISSLHLKIFGYTKEGEKGEPIKVKGLKDQLENSYSQLTSQLVELQKEIETSKTACTDVKTHWDGQHTSLKDKIESLLPGALTTGLSYAYKDKKDIEIVSMSQSNKSFTYAIYGLIAVSLIPFAISTYLLFKGTALEDVILKLPRIVMAILPLYIPVLWMAYSSSKKVNLSKRLIEEYSHKEALSKTFEGLSGQINNINDSQEKDELKAKLLYNLLEVSAENPGKLIYDYNNADHPLMDALDKSVKLTDAITKIANIPGMSKLTNILAEKDKKIKAEIDEKATDGLATTETT